MRISTLSRWFWRILLTWLSLYAVLTFFPPTCWPWRWMDLFQKGSSSCIPDTNFVIIDVGQLSRTQLALLLRRVAARKPCVIAMDLYFAHRRDPVEDTLLRESLCQIAREIPLYLPSDIRDASNPHSRPSVPVSDSFFASCTRKAFANLLFQDYPGGRIIRYARLHHISWEGLEPSLAWVAAQALDTSLSPVRFSSPVIPIRYRGNLACFYFLSGRDLLQDTAPSAILAQKAVFLGFADPLRQSTEDIFFTPLGVRPFVFTAPDMYGVVIHANIASMLYHRTFWKEIPLYLLYLISALTLLLTGLVADAYASQAYLRVRLIQVLLALLLVALFLYLSHRGYWTEAEIPFLTLLLAGEICLLTTPRRKSALA